MKRAIASASLVVLLPAVLSGQSTTTQLAFELADVHVSEPGMAGSGGFMPGGRIELRSTTMLEMITVAYGVEPAMVVGGPSWLNSNKFDVIAKAPTVAASEGILQAMLKTLLADRFKTGGAPGYKGDAGLCADSGEEWVEATAGGESGAAEEIERGGRRQNQQPC